MKLALLSLIPATLAATRIKSPAFVLAGDSTTAVQAESGGGWGNGFLASLRNGATGVNKGHNGATTKSFVDGGDWDVVKGLVIDYKGAYNVYVTIQFGHNDQKNTSGLTLAQYQDNLVDLAGQVWDWGATPILLTPLTRRNFGPTNHTLIDSLHAERLATITAASNVGAIYLDLNQASANYVSQIGEEASHAKYNLVPDDNTHLNAWGSVVFGRMVTDLLLEKKKCLGRWITPNETLSDLIWSGLPA